MLDRKSSRIDDIEVLRAIAVLFTVLTHIPGLFPWEAEKIAFKNYFVNFATGPDLFFAVSGFVIARDLIPQLEASRNRETAFRTLAAFWIRRIYRIWPTSWVWLCVVMACCVVFLHHGTFSPLHVAVADFVSIAMQVANLHIWSCVNGHPGDCGIDTGVWWSLSLEEQFYIIFPFIVILFRRKLPYFLGFLVISQIFLPRPAWGTSILWWIRTDAISLGVLLALFSRTREYQIIRPLFLENGYVTIAVVGILVLLLATSQGLPTKIDPVPFSTGLVTIIATALVWIASYNGNYLARGRIFKPVMMWLGSRSYALYLIHAVCLNLTPSLWLKFSPGIAFGPSYNLRWFLVWAVLTFGLTELNYRFIETPLRKRGRSISTALQIGAIRSDVTGAHSHTESAVTPAPGSRGR